ncbi:IscS subfamily cysteine desulfurase [Candidatus Kapaibacterium sp.]
MIYLDNNSTTKVDERVIEAMNPYMSELYANPSSSHTFGTLVKNHLERARNQIAEFIGANPKNIIFTSGSSESINLSIKGIAQTNTTERKKIVLLSTEHKAVIETCKSLQSIGYDIVFLPVMADGLVDLNEVESNIDTNTLLFASMLVNNETGIIQPIAEIANIVKSKGSYFFCDATQAPGKIEFNVESLQVDMLCFSGHKFYAPRGIGVLYLSNDITKGKLLTPQIVGGGQEGGLRSGTQNVPAIIGLAKATEIVKNELNQWQTEVGQLRNLLETELLKIEGTKVNGNINHRVFNTSNICFSNFDVQALQANLKNISISNGSACTSMNIEPSHVLLAMGLSPNEASNSIRFSLGKDSKLSEIEMTISEINKFFY